jgi:hypothetical protein
MKKSLLIKLINDPLEEWGLKLGEHLKGIHSKPSFMRKRL